MNNGVSIDNGSISRNSHISRNSSSISNPTTTLHHDNGHNDDKENDDININNVVAVYAIRKCKALHGAAIFTSWDDCNAFIHHENKQGKNNNDDDDTTNDNPLVEYETFSSVLDALNYIGLLSFDNNNNNNNHHHRNNDNNTMTVAVDEATVLPGTTALATTAETAAAAAATTTTTTSQAAATTTETKIIQLPPWNTDDGETEEEQQQLVLGQNNNNNNNNHLPETQEQITQIIPPQEQEPQLPKQLLLGPPPRRKYKKRPFRSKWENVFDDMVEQLKEYKEQFGTTHVPVSANQETEWSDLAKWVVFCRKHMKLYETDPTLTEYITTERHDILLKNDFVIDPKPLKKSKWEDVFEDMVEQLKEYKEKHGTSYINVEKMPKDSEYYELAKWVYFCRKELKLYKDDPTSTRYMTEERYNMLLDNDLTMEPMNYVNNKQKWDDVFFDMVEQLKNYKEKYDTTHVGLKANKGTEFDELAKWVNYCRRHLKLYQEDPTKTDYITKERYDILMYLDFKIEPLKEGCCSYNSPFKKKQREELFQEMFTTLQEFKQEFGHVDVKTTVAPKYKKLRIWIEGIRREYIKFNQSHGKSEATLTLDQIGKLTQLGFDFNQTKKWRSFEEHAHNWLEFRMKHDGRDPTKFENPGIYNFIWRCRTKYKATKENNNNSEAKNTLTEEQIQQLTSWGFQWTSAQNNGNRKQPGERKSWEERFRELVEWKEQHGNCLVPQKVEGLGTWVHDQRLSYKYYVEGKKKIRKMDETRIKKLRDIGFVFLTRKRGSGSNNGNSTKSSSLREKNNDNNLDPSSDIKNYRQLPPPLWANKNKSTSAARNKDSGTLKKSKNNHNNKRDTPSRTTTAAAATTYRQRQQTSSLSLLYEKAEEGTDVVVNERTLNGVVFHHDNNPWHHYQYY